MRAVEGVGGGAVLVAGEAGIGKSRLVGELESRAREVGALALVGECLELAEGELAFAPVVSALRPVMEDVGSLEGFEPGLRSALGALWPGAGEGDAPGVGREQLFEAVYRVLARFSARVPVVLIVEDVHWIDSSSRDLLAFIVHNARRDRLMVVATYRSDELRRGHSLRSFVAELERSGRAERLELGGLQREEVADQVEAILGHAPRPAVIEAVFARCEGNPFFAEELLAGSDPAGAALPGSLRELVLMRVERMSERTRDVLRSAAVIGRSVDHRLLASVVAGSEKELLAALGEATEHHLLVASEDGIAYTFRHALVQEAIYLETLPGDRLRLHRVIAQALSALPALATRGGAAERAHHWHAAGELSEALAASVQAAREAERMHAYQEALRQIERVLELWDKVPNAHELAAQDRVEVLLRAAELADWAGDAGIALERAHQARRAVDDSAEPLRAAAAEAKIARSLWTAGRGDDALEHLARAVRLVPERPPSVDRADALAAEGRALMLTGAPRRARDRLEEARALAQPLGARLVEASALNTLAIVYAESGEWDRAAAAGREGLRIATELGAGREMVRSYINGSTALDYAGRLDEALVLGLEGIEASHRLGFDRGPGDQLRVQAGWRLIRLGRLDEAANVIGPAVENATTQFNVAASKLIAGYLAAARGELDVAKVLLEQSWELAQRSGGFQLVGLALAWRVALHLWRGELERAHDLVDDGLARVSGAEGQLVYNAEFYWLAVRVQAERAGHARALRDLAGTERAITAATGVAAAFDAAVSACSGDGAPPESLAYQALARAELQRAKGDPDVQAWHAAGQRFRDVGEPYPAAYADLCAAEALALAGVGASKVAEPLRRAHTTATALGLRPFLEEVKALARRTGVALAEADGVDRTAAQELGLSDREAEVLALLAEGRTNRQIGEELFITSKTASVHVSRILAKLGVANRAEAAAAAHRLGLTRQRLS